MAVNNVTGLNLTFASVQFSIKTVYFSNFQATAIGKEINQKLIGNVQLTPYKYAGKRV